MRKYFVASILILTSSGSVLFAHNETATLLGTVTDSLTAVISGARFEVWNIGIGITSSVLTDEQRRY